MENTLTSLLNPRWADENHSEILCEITTTKFGDEVLPFCASPKDPEPYGQEMFADLVAGRYGPVAEYAPPTPQDTSTPPSGTLPSSIL